MFDHVEIRVSDCDRSRRFYETVLGSLGYRITNSGSDFAEWNDFGLWQEGDAPLTRRLHLAFVARSREEVDEFWRVGTNAGYRDDGAPGPRPQYHDEYYGSFLLDPDGNSVEAVHHGRAREGDNIVDHLWIRVRDLDASRAFYTTIAPTLGLRVSVGNEERFHVAARDRSFALVQGDAVTENVHLAFPVATDAAVAAFHAAAVTAGYRDNGRPGERPHYHPGYVGAFVLDPDGNNVEAVNHNRALA